MTSHLMIDQFFMTLRYHPSAGREKQQANTARGNRVLGLSHCEIERSSHQMEDTEFLIIGDSPSR